MPDHPKTWTHAETSSAGRPLTEEIARDHETLRQCYENYKKATTDDEKQEWVNQYVWTNARHAIAEGKSLLGEGLSFLSHSVRSGESLITALTFFWN